MRRRPAGYIYQAMRSVRTASRPGINEADYLSTVTHLDFDLGIQFLPGYQSNGGGNRSIIIMDRFSWNVP